MVFDRKYTDGTQLTELAELVSPDGKLTVRLFWGAGKGQLFYTAEKERETVLQAAQLGLRTGSADLSKGLTLAENAIRISKEEEFSELSCLLAGGDAALTVVLRVYKEGIAYRYLVEEQGKETGEILSETSEFVFPDDTVLWMGETSDTYEGNYKKGVLQDIKEEACEMSRPLLASVHGDKHWVLATEAGIFNTEEPYCASVFEKAAGEKNIHYKFGRHQETTPVVRYPFKTPWRVAIIAGDLNTLAGSRLVQKLNPLPEEKRDFSFVKPGKAVWSWWSSSYDAIEPQTQKDYIDFAAQNGWDYCLVDYGWELWEDYKEKVADIVAYGKEKKIGVFLWYGVNKFDNVHIFDLDNRDTIEEQFAWCESIGAAGVKIDYLNSDSQTSMRIMYDLAECAAEHHLMVVYHGCTNPSGEEVTFPNIVSYEAVRGEEYFKWNGQADVGTLLTYLFTRNVTGSMDFTPTAYRLSNSSATAGFQLAQSVVYESAVQHFAHSAYVYEGSEVLSFLNQVPTVWDASLYGGYPGEYNWTARKSGKDWYVGMMTAQARTAELSLDFLEKGKTYHVYLYRDNETGEKLETEKLDVTAENCLKLSLLNEGGAAAIITEREIETETVYDKMYTYYEAEDALLGGTCKKNDNNYASGLVSVGWIGKGKENSVTFTDVWAEKNGTYELKIFYIAGEERNLSVSVNEKECVTLNRLVSYAKDWAAPCRVTIPVTLERGKNSICLFDNDGYAPDIDRIAVSKDTREKCDKICADPV